MDKLFQDSEVSKNKKQRNCTFKKTLSPTSQTWSSHVDEKPPTVLDRETGKVPGAEQEIFMHRTENRFCTSYFNSQGPEFSKPI